MKIQCYSFYIIRTKMKHSFKQRKQIKLGKKKSNQIKHKQSTRQRFFMLSLTSQKCEMKSDEQTSADKQTKWENNRNLNWSSLRLRQSRQREKAVPELRIWIFKNWWIYLGLLYRVWFIGPGKIGQVILLADLGLT